MVKKAGSNKTPTLMQQMQSIRQNKGTKQQRKVSTTKKKNAKSQRDDKPDVRICSQCNTPRNKRPCELCKEPQSAVDRDYALLNEWEDRHTVRYQKKLPFRTVNGQYPLVKAKTKQRKMPYAFLSKQWATFEIQYEFTSEFTMHLVWIYTWI